MKKPFLYRITAIFLLLNFLNYTFFPLYSLALTSGPHQPEYTSYEEPGTTDMVNLLTGDFTFNLPVLEVPGPEGGFSLPLSYHAGIGLDQEASWVGLGFSLNAGAIARNVVEYPDDARGENFQIHRENQDITYGWTEMIPGFGTIGWDSNEGHHGTLSLLGLAGASYKNGSLSGGNLMGVHFSSKNVTADPVAVASAVLTVASFGTTAAAGGVAKAGTELAKSTALGMIMQGGMMAASVGSSTSDFHAGGGWDVSRNVSKRLKLRPFIGLTLRTEYNVWLDQTRYEDMYGVLYLGDMPIDFQVKPEIGIKVKATGFENPDQEVDARVYVTPEDINDKGATSDMHYAWNGKPYLETSNPASLAKDSYSVMGAGVSGSIEPYRLDIGTLSMPRDMTSSHIRIALSPFKPNYVWPDAYKVQFLYKGSFSNSYFFHVGSDGTTDENGNEILNINEPVFGIGHELESENPLDNDWIAYHTKDDTSLPEYFDLANPGRAARIQRDRPGLNDNKLSREKHITWYNQQELINKSTSGFIDYLTSEERKILPGNGTTIGGYSITKEDGSTYYYALPVYEQGNYTYIEDVNDPDNITEMKRWDAFPSTWLLTAITGPDFLDRNDNGKLDESDWGRWVKFSYGKFSDFYDWRIPYEGFRITEDGASKTYSRGSREQYYLNSIQTRTHTAIFLKDLRKDGRSVSNSQAGGAIASTLKLDEAVLLTNQIFEKLQSSYAFAESTSADTDYQLTSDYDTFEKVYDLKDLSVEARDFLNENALKRVRFNYNYELCKNTLNSYEVNEAGEIAEGRFGKLTLGSISILGRNSVKIAPDFRFEYGNNRNYSPDSWDGWGYYNPGGVANDPYSHNASEVDANGAAWSLKKILTPLGNTIEIDYERDSYSSVSGNEVFKNYSFADSDWEDGISVSNSGDFIVGEQVVLEGEYYYDCYVDNQTERFYKDFSNIRVSVTEVGSGYIKVSTGNITEYCSNGRVEVKVISGNIKKKIAKKGGDLRVASIKVKDYSGTEFTTRYLYTTNGETTGVSSGVISREPAYINGEDYPFYEFFDMPTTPVIYGHVSVLSGKLTTDNDFISKQVYEFETPDESMVSLYEDIIINNQLFRKLGYPYISEFLTKKLNIVNIKTSRIGNLKSVSTYNKNGEKVAGTRMYYSDDPLAKEQLYPNQGAYTEGTILAERVENDNYQEVYHRLLRTTKRYYPSVLTKVVTTKEGFTSVTENKEWDFITGLVLKNESTSPLGIKTLSETVPAYHIYPEMGPKAENFQNKHMLGQVAAGYTYRLNESGIKTGLISGFAQTWNKDWANYREYNAASGKYEDGNAEAHEVWRKHQSYAYEGTLTARVSDGSQDFTETNKFSFTESSNNTGWRYLGEINRYDHYSMPLESKDFTGIHGTLKMGYDNTYKIAEAGNARYTEIAYSGAEDEIAGEGYFSGEVAKGSGTVALKENGAPVHTGEASLQLSAGNGFVYTATELIPERTYRASVWTNSQQGKIYYKLNGGSAQMAAPTSGLKAGDWYLVNVNIPVGSSFSSLEVGVLSADGSTAYFDDFRFQPADAGMTAYVYNSRGELTFTLDNDNLYSAFEYDDTGRLQRTYTESMQYGGQTGRLQLSESRFNYGRFKADADEVRNQMKVEVTGHNNINEVLQFSVVNAVEEYGPYQFSWDFGDGTSETTSATSVSHTYTASGSKEVKLTVEVAEDNYRRTILKTVYIQGASCPAEGTLAQEFCELDKENNFCATGRLIRRYNDGNCGYYDEITEGNSECIKQSTECN